MPVKNVLLAALAASPAAAIYPNALHPLPHVHNHKERELEQSILSQLSAGSLFSVSSTDGNDNKKGNPPKAYNFSVPIDHFHNESRYEPHEDGHFDLRYWVDDTYYRPGGPVIMIGSGEFTSVARVPYITRGIGKILAEATGGLSVVMEHRYYGTSYPVPDLSPENMRFLTTEQALADTAYFARNIQYPGREGENLTSADSPYIFYGGSYAGAYAAFLRRTYPDDIWGAIAGSGVTQAIGDFWEYLEAFRLFAPPDCVETSEKIIAMTDAALTATRGDRVLAGKLKNLFDFDDDEIADDDFAYFTNWGTMTWQPTHWDPDEEDPHFARYCSAVTTDFPTWSSTRTARPDIELLLANAGYGDELATLAPRVMNWLGFSRDSLLHETIYPCTDVGKSCFSKRGAIDDVSVPQGMLRPWTYQTCVEWGYFVTGSGTPPDRKPLMSRLVTLEYASEWCRDVFNITAPPDLDRVNKHGGHGFSFPRVAFVDGSDDPWRQAGTHRIGLNDHRRSTDSEPFILIDGAVHHWDQYGPKPGAKGSWLPPKAVAEAHAEEVRFVKAWLEQWEVEKKGRQDQGGNKEEEEGKGKSGEEEVEEDYNELFFGQDDDNLEL
ncbi:hypothetical protein N3K66_004188 [Trichothecium roseum]|uniref:Uncharacterized protein n=1 Tax=Trichothecium roseum TaxID=47278 RepID=A0ACC0V2C9_9HYPO|nr:hypothetical protein N3K66_004188 [Trichothecium roseum]